VPSTWEGLIAGRSGAGPITRFDPAQSPVKFACEVKGFEPGRFLDKKEIRRYDLFAQFAIGAAEQAVTDACLANNWDKVDLKRVGAIVARGPADSRRSRKTPGRYSRRGRAGCRRSSSPCTCRTSPRR